MDKYLIQPHFPFNRTIDIRHQKLVSNPKVHHKLLILNLDVKYLVVSHNAVRNSSVTQFLHHEIV